MAKEENYPERDLIPEDSILIELVNVDNKEFKKKLLLEIKKACGEMFASSKNFTISYRFD